MKPCGKRTEVYSRVVGYFRPVENWNAGKQEEFKERRAYRVPPVGEQQVVPSEQGVSAHS